MSKSLPLAAIENIPRFLKRPPFEGRRGAAFARRTAIYQSIRNFPRQFLESWKIVTEVPGLSPWLRHPGARIFYAGMGGSSLPADLVNDYFAGDLQLHPIRDYQLPKSAGADDLVIAASFSGNTEETLSAFDAALRLRCKTLVLANGGKLAQAAQTAGVPWIKIPDCVQPRCAIGNFFASLLCLLHRLSVLDDSPLSILEDLSAWLPGIQDTCEAVGKGLAADLRDRVPIVYAPENLAGTARIWKIKFNENCKVQSFHNTFPELNHNEMVGYTKLLMKPALIFLESRFMHPKIQRRMDIMQELVEKDMPVLRLRFQGETPLRETFEALAVGDYASYHLAKFYGIDPAPVEMVEAFKRKL